MARIISSNRIAMAVVATLFVGACSGALVDDLSTIKNNNYGVYMYITDTAMKGSLLPDIPFVFPACSSADPLELANCLCTEEAKSKSSFPRRGKKFRAYLSTQITSALCNIQGKTGIGCLVPETDIIVGPENGYTNCGPDGCNPTVPLAANFSSLMAGDILRQFVSSTDNSNGIWTGTTTAGLPSSFDCLGWNSGTSGDTGQVGYPWHTDPGFLSKEAASCDIFYHLLCVEAF